MVKEVVAKVVNMRVRRYRAAPVQVVPKILVGASNAAELAEAPEAYVFAVDSEHPRNHRKSSYGRTSNADWWMFLPKLKLVYVDDLPKAVFAAWRATLC